MSKKGEAMENILTIARAIQFNEKAEAEAIEYYTDMLSVVAESEIDETDKNYVKSVIEEIISDELNHQQKLQALYTALTDIQPNKE